VSCCAQMAVSVMTVTADVHRAARLIDIGLRTFAAPAGAA